MRVLLTGATGYVGSGIARALLAHGHHVLGLARSERSAGALSEAGVEPVRASLADEHEIHRAVGEADAVITAAFPRDYLTAFDRAIALDQASVRLILAANENRHKPLLYTSGLGVVGDTGHRTLNEETAFTPPPHMVWRRQLEQQVLASAYGVVIRPPLVYGHGGGHVLETMIRTAAEHGRAVYPTPGTNAWPNVHVDDLGRAYALAIEQAAPGTVLHPIGGTSTARAMSKAAATLIGKPRAAFALPLDRARLELPIADWMTVSQHVDSRRTRSLLGWRPESPSITDDIVTGSYHGLIEAE